MSDSVFGAMIRWLTLTVSILSSGRGGDELKMLPGRNNDQVIVYVDGTKKVVGKSWENYYRDSEGHEPGTVNQMIFQARTSGGTASDPVAILGNGYLITNVTSTTSVS